MVSGNAAGGAGGQKEEASERSDDLISGGFLNISSENLDAREFTYVSHRKAE